MPYNNDSSLFHIPSENLWRNKGGFEAWCNLEGQYTHIVFDYSPADSIATICSLGIFGTRYIRQEPLDLGDLSVL